MQPHSRRHKMNDQENLKYVGYLSKLKTFIKLLSGLQSFMDNIELKENKLIFNTESALFRTTYRLSSSFEKLITTLIKKCILMNAEDSESICRDLSVLCGNLGLRLDDLSTTIKTLTGGEGIPDLSQVTEKINILNDIFNTVNNFEKFLLIAKEEVFTIKIPQIKKVNNEAYSALMKYMNLARHTVLNSEEFVHLQSKIQEMVSAIFPEDDEFRPPNKAQPYLAIIGPSFMGKTQTAFMLSRKFPVFYVNFSSTCYGAQNVYQAFKNVSNIFFAVVSADMAKLKSENISDFSTKCLLQSSHLKLKTVGLLWRLMLISLEFDFDDPNQNWFEYYLKGRDIDFEALSVEMFWKRMSEMDSNVRNRYPVVFIDEYSSENGSIIKLLRNLSRILVLPCFLSSTNSIITNILNPSLYSSKGGHPIWVHVIRKLIKANVDVISKNIGIEEYVQNGVIDVSQLLAHFNITFNNEELQMLVKIFKFICEQTKTSLQGTIFNAFVFLIEALEKQSNSVLESVKIWTSICKYLHNEFRNRKPQAFRIQGLFFSLRMFSINSNQIKKLQFSGASITQEDVNSSINEHFFYFGANDSNDILSLDYDPKEGNLYLDGQIYNIISFYTSVGDDFFTTCSLWHSRPDYPSVARIVEANQKKLIGIIPNDNALSNDSRSQEVMTYWSSSHLNFIGVTESSQFASHFIGNVQMSDQIIPFPIDEMPSTLTQFLSGIKIPYLIPKSLDNLNEGLRGICNFGACERCPNSIGIDIRFDLDFNGTKSTGFAECKYTDEGTNITTLKEYVEKARKRKSPLSFLLCFNLNEDLKITNRLAKPVQIGPKRQKRDENIDMLNINIYSVFWSPVGELKMIPLIEYERPNGVFIVVESNFKVAKI